MKKKRLTFLKKKTVLNDQNWVYGTIPKIYIKKTSSESVFFFSFKLVFFIH